MIARSELLHFCMNLRVLSGFRMTIAGLNIQVSCHAISNENFQVFVLEMRQTVDDVRRSRLL